MVLDDTEPSGTSVSVGEHNQVNFVFLVLQIYNTFFFVFYKCLVYVCSQKFKYERARICSICTVG